MPWAPLAVLGAGAWLGAASLSWFSDDETARGWDWTINVFLIAAAIGAAAMGYVLYGFVFKPLIEGR